MESREKEVLTGWKKQSEKYSEPIIEFLSVAYDRSKNERARYDTMELQFSGTNSRVLEKIKNKKISPLYVNVLYEDGAITQIHAVFDSEGKGQNLDIYLTGRAVEDFLANLK